MSNYFQSLKRLEQEQAVRNATPDLPATRIESVGDVAPGADKRNVTKLEPHAEAAQRPVQAEAVAQPTLRVLDRPGLPAERTVGSYTTLFDNLRAIGNGAPVGSVVISAASTVESVDRISNGLADEVCRHSLRVVVAELSRSVSQPMLKIRLQSRDEGPAGSTPDTPPPASSLTLDLRGGPVPAELAEWMNAARAHYDMVILEAPPLGLSVDAAMLARACDGLILTVEARGTSKDILMDAIGRADTVGCPLLGIVMQGRPERTPRWLRRLTALRNLF